jgi:hypothetical protein
MNIVRVNFFKPLAKCLCFNHCFNQVKLLNIEASVVQYSVLPFMKTLLYAGFWFLTCLYSKSLRANGVPSVLCLLHVPGFLRASSSLHAPGVSTVPCSLRAPGLPPFPVRLRP